MQFVSTRDGASPVGFSTALETGLASDGGLWVPAELPRVTVEAGSLHEIAAAVLAPFLADDPLGDELPAIAENALSFPLPTTRLQGTAACVLELFHGPTAAFKDVGARFLAECLARRGGETRTILVATSGDTGGAVAAAFDGRPGFEVVILFPKGAVSARQQQQLTCWGDNVRAFAVRGVFDDCQRMLKAVLADPTMRARHRLTTANSINIGRLLPQVVYYATAGLHYLSEHGTVPGFLVPSGNVGNATAALWAKRMGLPVGHVMLVTNANRTVPDFFGSGVWRPRPSVTTLANAMDVGDPSNMERVRHLYPQLDALEHDASSVAVDDADIERTIRDGVARYGRVFDPHTATAVHVLDGTDSDRQVVVATAHPAKFDTIVEPLVGRAVPPPPALAELLDRPSRFRELDPEPRALAAELG